MLLSALLAGACLPGYDPCFDPAAVIRSPTLLAVRADPPEAIYQPGDAAPQIRLRALVALPANGVPAPVQFQLRLCSPDPLSRCDDAVAPVVALSTDTENIDVLVQVPPAVIAQALVDDPLRGYGGVRVLADLSLEGTGVSLRGGKLLLFSPHGAVPNRPIELDGLHVAGPGRAAGTLVQGDHLNLNVQDNAVPVDQRPDVAQLTPVLRPGSLEEYDVTDLAGRRVHLLDQVSYGFHATLHLYFGDPKRLDANGGFSGWDQLVGADVGDEPLAGAPPPAHGLVRVRGMAAATNGRIWVVAHDTRGAEAWLWVYAGVTDARCCDPEICATSSKPTCPDLAEPICDWSDLEQAKSFH